MSLLVVDVKNVVGIGNIVIGLLDEGPTGLPSVLPGEDSDGKG